MTSIRFELPSLASLRTIAWKPLAAAIACAILTTTVVHAELPVVVPSTTAALLTQEQHADIYWSAFRLLSLAIPLFVLCTGLGARLRRRCERICGNRWFWTVTLFACAYLALAALIAMPFDFYAGYVQPHAAGHADPSLLHWLKGDSVPLLVQLDCRISVPLDSLSADDQEPAPLVALLRCGTVSGRLSGDGRVAGVGSSADDDLQAAQRSRTRNEDRHNDCAVRHRSRPSRGRWQYHDGDRHWPDNRIVLQSNLATVETSDEIVFTVGHEMNLFIAPSTANLNRLIFALFSFFLIWMGINIPDELNFFVWRPVSSFSIVPQKVMFAFNLMYSIYFRTVGFRKFSCIPNCAPSAIKYLYLRPCISMLNLKPSLIAFSIPVGGPLKFLKQRCSVCFSHPFRI